MSHSNPNSLPEVFDLRRNEQYQYIQTSKCNSQVLHFTLTEHNIT